MLKKVIIGAGVVGGIGFIIGGWITGLLGAALGACLVALGSRLEELFENRNIIKVKWVNDKVPMYAGQQIMEVVESTHPRFIKGTRFDYGYAEIALEEGYTIVPLTKRK